MIDIDEVSVSFGDTEVLSSVSLSVPEGELVGLVGPNGAGKTTLLRTVSGAITPDSGAVEVDGSDVHELPSKEASRRVAVVPQETSLSFEFSVREIVAMGRHPYRKRFGRNEAVGRAYVDRALERTQTAALSERSIEAVSGGERKRVLIARAIAQNTPTLLLDEPTASLDLNHAVETMTLVRELVDDGRAAVAAVHDLSLATRYCDRIAVLSDGRLIDVGVPERIVTPERIAEAFDVRSIVRDDPVGGLDVRPLPAARRSGRVHVLGVGKTAAAVVGRLGAAGYELSVGPVPAGDRAAETCRAFGGRVVAVPTFDRPDERDRDRSAAYVEEADVTVLADPALTARTRVWTELAGDVDRLVTVEERPLSERAGEDWEIVERYRTVRDRSTVTVLGSVEAVVESVIDADPIDAPRQQVEKESE